MTIQKFAALGLLATLATGCNNGWDGSWLFRMDPNSEARSGDCADTGGDAPDTYFGTQDEWADMVLLGNGQIAINVAGNELLGSETGGTLTATAVDGVQSADGSLDRTTYTLTATRNGGSMTGTITVLEESEGNSYYGDPSSYTCTTTASFVADRVVSDHDEFVSPTSSF